MRNGRNPDSTQANPWIDIIDHVRQTPNTTPCPGVRIPVEKWEKARYGGE